MSRNAEQELNQFNLGNRVYLPVKCEWSAQLDSQLRFLWFLFLDLISLATSIASPRHSTTFPPDIAAKSSLIKKTDHRTISCILNWQMREKQWGEQYNAQYIVRPSSLSEQYKSSLLLTPQVRIKANFFGMASRKKFNSVQLSYLKVKSRWITLVWYFC